MAVTRRSQSTACDDLREGSWSPSTARAQEKPWPWMCGATRNCWHGPILHCCWHRSSLPGGGCPCWAPEPLLVLFQPGCQPGKQSSQPKREQVGRNRENGSDIPACHQRRFQSNGAGEAEPAELPDEWEQWAHYCSVIMPFGKGIRARSYCSKPPWLKSLPRSCNTTIV